MAAPPPDGIEALRVLRRHGVRFVVIGGIAAQLHGSEMLTNDADVCYARDDENLERLTAGLHDLEATLRGAPANLPFQLDPETLRNGDSFTFSTRCGPLDCLGTPSGSDGYPDLIRDAMRIRFDDLEVDVVSFDALVRMKTAAGRPKDRIALEHLQSLREERDEQERGG